ncbi:MAG: recombinase family protein [Peptostreptococcaceae bacterium]|nr:recombinase family protein [Peptostreptococcaceae bacterium]
MPKLYSKKCFGYDHCDNGNLIIKEDEAATVRLIYKSYLQGYSLRGLRKLLVEKRIQSPTCKYVWSYRTIEKILENEKYTGDSLILSPRDKNDTRNSYLYSNHHPAIISRQMYDAVQLERSYRSNVIETEDGKRRNSTKYRFKRKY